MKEVQQVHRPAYMGTVTTEPPRVGQIFGYYPGTDGTVAQAIGPLLFLGVLPDGMWHVRNMRDPIQRRSMTVYAMNRGHHSHGWMPSEFVAEHGGYYAFPEGHDINRNYGDGALSLRPNGP